MAKGLKVLIKSSHKSYESHLVPIQKYIKDISRLLEKEEILQPCLGQKDTS